MAPNLTVTGFPSTTGNYNRKFRVVSISIIKKFFTVANLLKWIAISDSLHTLVNIAYSQRNVAQAFARMEIQRIIAHG